MTTKNNLLYFLNNIDAAKTTHFCDLAFKMIIDQKHLIAYIEEYKKKVNLMEKYILSYIIMQKKKNFVFCVSRIH